MGLNKGEVIDLHKLSNAISKAVEKAEEMAGFRISNITCNITGGLPFTKTGRYGGLNISYLYNLNSVQITHALVDVNSTQIFLYTFSGSSVSNASVAGALTNDTQIMLNGIYFAA